jgi:DNA-binding transcriptional LysR family regulator
LPTTDLNELAVFAAIAETGSLVGAAVSLGQPRSTISKKLADLERRLGRRLFRRTTRRVELTPAGRQLLVAVAPGLRLLREAEAEVQAFGEKEAPLVTISAPPLLAQNALGGVAAEAIRRHPGLRIRVLSAIEFDPTAPDIDIRLSAHPVGRPPPGSTVVAQSRRGLYASPGYLADWGSPARPEDVQPERLIMRQPAESLEIAFGRTTAALHCRGPLVCVDHETVRDALLANLCIGVLPQFIAAPFVSSGRLTTLLPRWGFPPIPIAATVGPTAAKSPWVATILELLPANLSRAGFGL